MYAILKSNIKISQAKHIFKNKILFKSPQRNFLIFQKNYCGHSKLKFPKILSKHKNIRPFSMTRHQTPDGHVLQLIIILISISGVIIFIALKKRLIKDLDYDTNFEIYKLGLLEHREDATLYSIIEKTKFIIYILDMNYSHFLNTYAKVKNLTAKDSMLKKLFSLYKKANAKDLQKEVLFKSLKTSWQLKTYNTFHLLNSLLLLSDYLLEERKALQAKELLELSYKLLNHVSYQNERINADELDFLEISEFVFNNFGLDLCPCFENVDIEIGDSFPPVEYSPKTFLRYKSAICNNLSVACRETFNFDSSLEWSSMSHRIVNKIIEISTADKNDEGTPIIIQEISLKQNEQEKPLVYPISKNASLVEKAFNINLLSTSELEYATSLYHKGKLIEAKEILTSLMDQKNDLENFCPELNKKAKGMLENL